MMDRSEALARLHEIVSGIDRTEGGEQGDARCFAPAAPVDDHDGGWWETSVGADFGAFKLAALERLIQDLTG